MRKIFKILVSLVLISFLLLFFYLFIGEAPKAEKIQWGIVFSQKHSILLNLNWKENYLAILDDLKVKNLKIITHWDLIEKEKGKYDFEDLDWQIREAEKRGAKITLVIGIKTGRWPECHIPGWVEIQNSKFKSQNDLFEYLKKIVNHYKDSKAISAWQVENEPFFPFGVCPKIKKELLKKEIQLVKSLDFRPVIFGESGEFSFWIEAAKFGDIVGTTLHRKIYFHQIKMYLSYPFPPVYYWRKAKVIKKFFGKKVINTELQAEPWCKNLLYSCDLKEQEKTMNLKQLKENIEFAQKTGLDTFYLWGAEWWYWMKEKQNKPDYWTTIKEMIIN